MTALKMVADKPLTGNIGAVEDSINPAELIQGAQKSMLWQALWDHQKLIVHGPNLDIGQLETVTEVFGSCRKLP